MSYNPSISIPKFLLTILNNLYDIQRKASKDSDPHNILRNVEKITESLIEQQIYFEDPLGQPFSETRTDLEATIAGSNLENLIVVEVIKPIIRVGNSQISTVVQKGIVVVESRK